MNITKIISKVFDSRLKAIDLYDTQAGEIQHRVLTRLVKQAENTEWGKKYDYKSIRNYEDFKNRLPIQTYEEVKPYVERLRAGEQNLLWPSEIRWFAKSSGTTNDKSKFLPVSKEALEDIHYRGGKDAAAIYFRMNPEHRNVGLYELPAPADHVVERLNACRVLCGRLLTPRGDEPAGYAGQGGEQQGYPFHRPDVSDRRFRAVRIRCRPCAAGRAPLPSGTPRSKPPA